MSFDTGQYNLLLLHRIEPNLTNVIRFLSLLPINSALGLRSVGIRLAAKPNGERILRVMPKMACASKSGASFPIGYLPKTFAGSGIASCAGMPGSPSGPN